MLMPRSSFLRFCARLLCIGLVTGLISEAAAQIPAGTALDSLGAASRDSVLVKTAESFAAPESPAFTFLNFAPASVTRPNTPRDFVAALANGIDEDGKVRQGISLEVTPSYLIPGLGVPLDQYQKSFFKRVLANTQLSVATVRSAGDTAATDLGLGIRLTLIDNGDPMSHPEFTNVLGDQLLTCSSGPPDFKPALDCLGAVNERLRAQFLQAHWNATRLSVAFATGLRFNQSQVSETSALGWNGWAALTAPLGSAGQMVGYFAFTHRPVLSGAASFSSVDFGGRLLVGSPGFNAFAEVVGNSRFNTSDASNTSSAAWSGGVEFKAADKLWLSTGFGKRFGDMAKPDRVIVIANLRWAVSSRARIR